MGVGEHRRAQVGDVPAAHEDDPAACPGLCRTGPSCALLPVRALGSRSAGQGPRLHAPACPARPSPLIGCGPAGADPGQGRWIQNGDVRGAVPNRVRGKDGASARVRPRPHPAGLLARAEPHLRVHAGAEGRSRCRLSPLPGLHLSAPPFPLIPRSLPGLLAGTRELMELAGAPPCAHPRPDVRVRSPPPLSRGHVGPEANQRAALLPPHMRAPGARRRASRRG